MWTPTAGGLDRFELIHDPDAEALAGERDDLLHQDLRGRGASRQAEHPHAAQPLGADVLRALDQLRRDAVGAGDLAHAQGIGAVGRAEHEQHVHVRRHRLDGVLPVLRGVADVLLRGRFQVGEAALQDGQDVARVVDRKGRLRQVRDAVRIGNGDLLGVFARLDEADGLGRLAERADGLVVVVVADEDDRVALAGVVDRFQVHLRHERAGRVDRAEVLLRGHLADGGRDAVGRENERRVVGDLVHLFDEAGALFAQLVHDVAVVDDLLADVHGPIDDLERLFDDVDRAHHAGAEAPQTGDEELLDLDPGKIVFRRHQVTVSANFFSGREPSEAGAFGVERTRSG